MPRKPVALGAARFRPLMAIKALTDETMEPETITRKTLENRRRGLVLMMFIICRSQLGGVNCLPSRAVRV